MIGAERPMCRSVSGECNILMVAEIYSPSPIRCEAALSKKSPPVQTQKLSCTATAAQRTQKIPTHQSGGCCAGKFGEGQGGLEGR